MRKQILLLSILGCGLCLANNHQTRVMHQDNFPGRPSKNEVFINKPVIEGTTDGKQLFGKKKAIAKENEETLYPVEIEIAGGNFSFIIYTVNESGANVLWPEMDFALDEEAGIATVMLPKGTMDLVLEFNNMFINEEIGYFVNLGLSYYFIEDVVVDENTPRLRADINECELLPISIVMANGEPLQLATKNWDGTQMGEPIGGNCIQGSSIYTLYNKKYDTNTMYNALFGVPNYYTGIGLDAESHNPLSFWIPSCNKASDNWSCIMKINTFTTDRIGGYAALSLKTTQSIEMNGEDYKKHEWNFPTEGFEALDYNFGVSFNGQDRIMISGFYSITDKPYDMNLAVISKAEGIENLSLMSQTKFGTEVDSSDPDWPVIYGLLSPWSATNTSECIFQPASTMFTQKPWEEEDENWRYYPEFMWGNEYANYSQNQLGMKFGTTTPFVVSSVWKYTDHDTDALTGFSLYKNILDLTGADRSECDKPLSEVYFNGELVKEKDNEATDFLDMWDVATQGIGKMKYVLYDTPNFKIEDMQPTNITEISYTQDATTWEPPTLTSLLFENADEEITNRFSARNNAAVKFFAGGTEWHRFWYLHPWANRWFAHDSQSITYDITAKLEYAPYGSDNWTSLEISENIEQRSPALGNHYSASLSQVDAQSENGWFDLRISLETPDGNSQVQTLSPAFFIEENKGAGINHISSETIQVRYYDLFGMPASNPSKGQILIRIDSNGVSKIRF